MEQFFRALYTALNDIFSDIFGLEPVDPALGQNEIKIIKDDVLEEIDYIVAIEQYPLDKIFGNQVITSVRQISRESTNELSIDAKRETVGKLGADILSAIKAEIEAHISLQSGLKIGEKLTESQTLTFSVGPNSSVVYELVWKRKTRKGERIYLLGGN